MYLTSVPGDFQRGSGGQYSEDGFALLTKGSTLETVEGAGKQRAREPLDKNSVFHRITLELFVVHRYSSTHTPFF